jgi:hypothetical protein
MAGDDRSFKFTRSRREAAITETEARAATTLSVLKSFVFATNFLLDIPSRSGLVVKFVLAMHEPRVRFTAATSFCQIVACYQILFAL